MTNGGRWSNKSGVDASATKFSILVMLSFSIELLNSSARSHLPSLPSQSPSAVFSLPEGKMLSYFGIVPEGHILDIPNGILGMIFYLYTIIGYVMRKTKTNVGNDGGGTIMLLFAPMMNLVICSLAIASSAFLARKLYILRELCVVCVTTHIINMTLWIRAFSMGREGSLVEHRSTKVKAR